MLYARTCKAPVIEINYYAPYIQLCRQSQYRGSWNRKSSGRTFFTALAHMYAQLRMHRVPNSSQKDIKAARSTSGCTSDIRWPHAFGMSARTASADPQKLIELFSTPSTTFLSMQPSVFKSGSGFGDSVSEWARK